MMKTTEILFTREDGRGIDVLALVRISHDDGLHTQEQVLAALKEGITRWVETSEEGRKQWDYSSGDLNIGDLLCEEFSGPLKQACAQSGIHSLECVFELGGHKAVPFDTVLADPKEQEEPWEV